MEPSHFEQPLVSIVIPTHNRAGLLPRALHSALGQHYPSVEVVVVDDGSSDETPDLLQKWQLEHPNLLWVRNEKPQGASAARNRGFREAGGEYLALLDDDDEFTPERLQVLMNYQQQHPNCSFVSSDYINIRRNGVRRSRKPGPISLRKMLWMNYASQSVLTRREYMLAIGGFDESLSAAQDYDAFTRLIEVYGPAYRVAEALYIYHQEHDAPRITATPAKRIRGYYDYYAKHRQHMSPAQRSWHLYRIMKLRGRKITPGRFLRYVPLRFYLLELNDFLIEHTNLYLWLNRLKQVLQGQA